MQIQPYQHNKHHTKQEKIQFSFHDFLLLIIEMSDHISVYFIQLPIYILQLI